MTMKFKKIPKNLQIYLDKLNRCMNPVTRQIIFYRLGIDTGVGSAGLSVIEDDKYGNPVKILEEHSITFDKGTVAKTGQTLNTARRNYRRSNRNIGRTYNRKQYIKKLFQNYGILSAQREDKTLKMTYNVYRLRDTGLHRKLSPAELFHVIYFFGGNRAYQQITESSNADGDLTQSLTDTEKYFNKAKKQKGYQTIGEMLHRDSKFAYQKRNRRGHFNASFKRENIKKEMKKILRKQAGYYPQITSEFTDKCMLIFKQRTFDEGVSSKSPYSGGIKDKVSLDPLNPTELVAPVFSATFEYYRLLNNLNNLRYFNPDKTKGTHTTSKASSALKPKPTERLTHNQRELIMQKFYCVQSISYKALAKLLGMPDAVFNNNKKKIFCKEPATIKISRCLKNSKPKTALTKAEQALVDKIGTVLTYYSSPEMLESHLRNITHFAKQELKNIISLEAKKNISKFSNVSFKTMNALLPFLKKGTDLYYAKLQSGLISKATDIIKHAVTYTDLQQYTRMYTNPVQIRSMHILLQAINDIVQRLGKPDYIFIERGRDVSHTKAQRKAIAEAQQRNWHRHEKASEYFERRHFADSKDNYLKYRLYHRKNASGEKGYRDIYPPFAKLTPRQVYSQNDIVEIDHVQPEGVSWNNSTNNRFLTTKAHNQEKGERTPYEWFGQNADLWHKYVKHINDYYPKWEHVLDKNGKYKTKKVNQHEHGHVVKDKSGKPKKELKYVYRPINIGIRTNLLRHHPVDASRQWQPRDLVNNQTVAGWLISFLRQHMHYRQSSYLTKQHTYQSNGRITSLLRHSYHIPKVRANGDEHHAIDATLIAIATPSLHQKVVRFYKYHHTSINATPVFPEPYKGFKQDLAKHSVTMIRKHKHNNTPKIAKDTKYGLEYNKQEHQWYQIRHCPVIKLAYKKATKKYPAIIGYNNYAWKLADVYPKHVVKSLELFLDKIGKASKKQLKKMKPYVKVDKHRFYSMKLVKPLTAGSGIISKRYHCISPHNSNAYVMLFKKDNQFVPIKLRPYDIQRFNMLKHYGTPCLSIRDRYQQKGYQFLFNLEKFQMIDVQFTQPRLLIYGKIKQKDKAEIVRAFKKHDSQSLSLMNRRVDVPRFDYTDHFRGCYRRLSGGAFLIQPNDLTSQGQAFASVGMSGIKSIQLLQPDDFFGTQYVPASKKFSRKTGKSNGHRPHESSKQKSKIAIAKKKSAKQKLPKSKSLKHHSLHRKVIKHHKAHAKIHVKQISLF